MGRSRHPEPVALAKAEWCWTVYNTRAVSGVQQRAQASSLPRTGAGACLQTPAYTAPPENQKKRHLEPVGRLGGSPSAEESGERGAQLRSNLCVRLGVQGSKQAALNSLG